MCDDLITTFEPVYLTEYSDGFIVDENNNQNNISFNIEQPYNSTYTVTGTTTNSTTFLGWSLYKPNRYNYVNFDKLTSLNIYQHTFLTNNVKIYGWFLKDGPVTMEFCFYSTPSGYVANEVDKEFYCTTCNVLSTVYFNKTNYETNGIEGVTWYQNEGLSSVVNDGYYKINEGNNSILYKLTNGTPTPSGLCGNKSQLICDDNLL